MAEIISQFWAAFLNTLALTAMGGVFSLIAGIALGICRDCPVPILRSVSAVYVAVIRNSPSTVLFYVGVFVGPQLGIRLSYFWFAVIILTIYYTAFFCEVIRAGLNSVAPGQVEAARSLGLGFGRTIAQVVIPQAVRSTIPPIVNTLVAVARSSSIAGAFGVMELFANMQRLANVESQYVLTILAVTGVCYLIVTLPLSLIAAQVEARVVFAR